MIHLTIPTALALALFTTSAVRAQTESRPAADKTMKTVKTTAPEIETATFAVG